jgi:hypothetical protein
MFINLFDFSSEKDIEEALIFYFVYFVIGFYILVTFGFVLANINSLKIFGYLFFIIPSIFCASISILSMCKKRLNNPEAFFHLGVAIILPFVSSIVVSLFIPVYGPFIGLALGILPATILVAKEDNNFYIFDAIQQKERLQQTRKIEMQLLKEQATELKRKELEKVLTT